MRFYILFFIGGAAIGGAVGAAAAVGGLAAGAVAGGVLAGIQNSKFEIRNSHRNSKFEIRNPKFKIQNSKFEIQNSKFKIQNSKQNLETHKLIIYFSLTFLTQQRYCPFADFGCPVSLPRGQLGAHLQECQYIRIVCMNKKYGCTFGAKSKADAIAHIHSFCLLLLFYLRLSYMRNWNSNSKLEIRSSKLELEFWNSKFKNQNSKFKIQNSKFKIQNSKFKIRN